MPRQCSRHVVVKDAASMGGRQINRAYECQSVKTEPTNVSPWKQSLQMSVRENRAYECQSAAFFRVVGTVTATPCTVGETIHMCSVMMTRNFSSSLFIPHARLFRQLTTACTSSPPCSPCSPRPKPCWRMNGTVMFQQVVFLEWCVPCEILCVRMTCNVRRPCQECWCHLP